MQRALVDELMTNAPGTEIVLLLKEKSEGIISGSVRTTTPSADASSIAEMFGGGGHVRAAGFKIKSNDFYETEKMVVSKIRAYQKQRLNLFDEEVTETVVSEDGEGIEEMTIGAGSGKVEEMSGERQGAETGYSGRKGKAMEKEIEKSDDGGAEKSKEGGSGESKKDPGKKPASSKKAASNAHAKKDQPQATEEGETFTDKIIKMASDKDEGTDIEEGITYKFEV